MSAVTDGQVAPAGRHSWARAHWEGRGWPASLPAGSLPPPCPPKLHPGKAARIKVQGRRCGPIPTPPRAAGSRPRYIKGLVTSDWPRPVSCGRDLAGQGGVPRSRLLRSPLFFVLGTGRVWDTSSPGKHPFPHGTWNGWSEAQPAPPSQGLGPCPTPRHSPSPE